MCISYMSYKLNLWTSHQSVMRTRFVNLYEVCAFLVGSLRKFTVFYSHRSSIMYALMTYFIYLYGFMYVRVCRKSDILGIHIVSLSLAIYKTWSQQKPSFLNYLSVDINGCSKFDRFRYVTHDRNYTFSIFYEISENWQIM